MYSNFDLRGDQDIDSIYIAQGHFKEQAPNGRFYLLGCRTSRYGEDRCSRTDHFQYLSQFS